MGDACWGDRFEGVPLAKAGSSLGCIAGQQEFPIRILSCRWIGRSDVQSPDSLESRDSIAGDVRDGDRVPGLRR